MNIQWLFVTLFCVFRTSSQFELSATDSTPIRLHGAVGRYAGRVEVLHNNTWGTMCDDSFTARTASVICGMLNLPTQGALARGSAFYGPGRGPIWLDDVVCTGNERDIALCAHRGWGNNDCSHSEDAAVICMGPCVDTRDCSLYSPDVCTEAIYHAFAGEYCRAYCKLCDPPVTLEPFECNDGIEHGTCREFDDGTLCTAASFYRWAKQNCYNYCGFPPCDNNTVHEITAQPTTIIPLG